VPGLRGFVSLENIGNANYQINLSGTGSAALISYGCRGRFVLGWRLSGIRKGRNSFLDQSLARLVKDSGKRKRQKQTETAGYNGARDEAP
jgi:hypothetical protein